MLHFPPQPQQPAANDPRVRRAAEWLAGHLTGDSAGNYRAILASDFELSTAELIDAAIRAASRRRREVGEQSIQAFRVRKAEGYARDAAWLRERPWI